MSADDRLVSAEAHRDPVDVAANRLLGAEGRHDAAEIKLWSMVSDLEKAKQKDDHVAVAEAEVAVAKAEVAVAKAKVDVAEAELRAAKAKLGSTESKLEKAIQSGDPAGIAEAKAAVAEAKAAVAEAKAAVSEAKVAVAEAEVRAAEGELEKAIQSGDPAGIAKQETKVAKAKAAVAKQEAAQEMAKAALDRAIRGLAIAQDAYELALHAGTGVFAVINRQGEAASNVRERPDTIPENAVGLFEQLHSWHRGDEEFKERVLEKLGVLGQSWKMGSRLGENEYAKFAIMEGMLQIPPMDESKRSGFQEALRSACDALEENRQCLGQGNEVAVIHPATNDFLHRCLECTNGESTPDTALSFSNEVGYHCETFLICGHLDKVLHFNCIVEGALKANCGNTKTFDCPMAPLGAWEDKSLQKCDLGHSWIAQVFAAMEGYVERMRRKERFEMPRIPGILVAPIERNGQITLVCRCVLWRNEARGPLRYAGGLSKTDGEFLDGVAWWIQQAQSLGESYTRHRQHLSLLQRVDGLILVEGEVNRASSDEGDEDDDKVNKQSSAGDAQEEGTLRTPPGDPNQRYSASMPLKEHLVLLHTFHSQRTSHEEKALRMAQSCQWII